MSNHHHLRHYTKNTFKYVSMTIMAMEVAAFLVFIFGTLGAILGTYSGISTTDFILLGFGGITVSFLLLAAAEILQVLLKIEFGVRKSHEAVQQEIALLEAEERKLNSLWSFSSSRRAAPSHKPKAKKNGKKKR